MFYAYFLFAPGIIAVQGCEPPVVGQAAIKASLINHKLTTKTKPGNLPGLNNLIHFMFMLHSS